MEIEGYENYLIYPDGKVQNKKTKRYLKQQINKNNGYFYISLWKNNKGKNYTIHRLVAQYYIPNPENKRCVDHINRDRKDNRLENLRWVTDSENVENTVVRKNNKLGIKNINYDKRFDRYDYQKIIDGKRHRKQFKTLEEAIEYKKQFESP